MHLKLPNRNNPYFDLQDHLISLFFNEMMEFEQFADTNLSYNIYDDTFVIA
jgi:hypothetical protein